MFKSINKINRLINEADDMQLQQNQQPQQSETDMIDAQPGVANKRQAIVYIEQTNQMFGELYSRLKVIKSKIYGSTELRQGPANDEIKVILTEFEKMYREFQQLATKTKSMA